MVKPHDPRQAGISAAEVEQQFKAILNRQPAGLPEQAEQLRQAHEILYAALHTGATDGKER